MSDLFSKYNIRECKIILNHLSEREYKIAQQNTLLMRYGIKECYVKVNKLNAEDLKQYTAKSTVRELISLTTSVREHIRWLPINPNHIEALPNRITRS